MQDSGMLKPTKMERVSPPPVTKECMMCMIMECVNRKFWENNRLGFVPTGERAKQYDECYENCEDKCFFAGDNGGFLT